MGLALDIMSFVIYIPYLKVDEEDIGRNMDKLKKYHWFQAYLTNENYRELIIHNTKVRQTIGKLNNAKLSNESYAKKCQKKVHQILLKQNNP